MCYTDNSAAHASVFLNAQLSSLWENSVACAKKLDLVQQTTANRYAIALAKYSSGRPRSGISLPQDFDATFNKPSLRFACNHDAILHLCIAEGQYVVTSSQKGRPTASGPGKPGKTKELKGVEVEFRIPFQVSSIQGGMSMIGASHDNVKLLSLDFSDPQLYFISSCVEEADREAVAIHLRGYLRLLQKAGHHILFCLPEFNDAELRYTVDFSSAIEKAKFDGVDSVFDIPTQSINDFLSVSWRNAVTSSDNSSSDGAGLVLAQYRSAWSSRDFGIHFNISFAAPTVQALCAREVLITFNIQNISFYEGGQLDSTTPLHEFTNWKISFLSTMEHERSQGGGSLIRFLPEQSSCHYTDQFSEFPSYDATGDTRDLKSRLKDFFVTEYLVRLERDKLHILYDSDGVFVVPGTHILEEPDEAKAVNDSDSGPTSPKVIIRQEVSITSDIGIFDAISAVSQAAVNLHFRTCWESSRTKKTTWNSFVTKWTHSDVFEAEFEPIIVRLLSNERAIVLIRMSTGRLNDGKTGLDKDVEADTFSHWRVAFEVPLVKCTHADIPGVDSQWMERFKQTTVFKEHGGCTDRDFCHIYANFKDAEYVPAFSQFGSLFSGKAQQNSVAGTKVTSLLNLMREHYLPLLIAAGYHVVHTIPVWKTGSPPIGAFTDFHFRVISETVVTRKTLEGRYDDPVIMIAGVGPMKALPELGLPLGWLIRLGGLMRSGAVILSHSLFLEPELLRICSAVNAKTTLVPVFSAIHGQTWGTWAEGRGPEPSDFELENDSPVGERRYRWCHKDGWANVPWGSSSSSQPRCTFSCHTTNRLIIPTAYNHELLDIQIEGRVELTTRYGTDQSDVWIARAAVNWGSNLYVRTHQGCLYISVDSAQPIYEDPTTEGNILDGSIGRSLEDVLRKYFDRAADFSGLSALFQQFKKPWKSSYPGEGAFNLTHPSFNEKGDLLFELRPLIAGSARPRLRPPPPRRLTLIPSNPLDARGRSGHQGSLHQQASSAERPYNYDHPRGGHSASRTQDPTNGRVSSAHPNSQNQNHGSGGHGNLRPPESGSPGGLHTLAPSRSASSKRGILYTEPDTTTLKQSPSPLGNDAGGLVISTRTEQVVTTEATIYTASPTSYHPRE